MEHLSFFYGVLEVITHILLASGGVFILLTLITIAMLTLKEDTHRDDLKRAAIIGLISLILALSFKL